MPISSSDL
jgi:DNA-directed RNA polymerase I subunit RPA1